MKPIDFHPGAASEARSAAQWYEREESGLGVAFQRQLDSILVRIRENPQLFAAESGPLRIAPFDRFSYGVVYEELDDRIWVAAVAHHSRRPDYWVGRRPG